MVPMDLTKKNFLQAAAEIDRDGVPIDRRSVHYDLVLNEKRYPPKYIVSLAMRFATGKEYPAADFNAVEAKNYFLTRGYTVIDRRSEAESIVVSEDGESGFPEGTVVYGQHRYLERDSKITKKAKAKRLADTDKLECEVCSLDFVKMYGELGRGFIEAHHTMPVSLLAGEVRTKIADLALVCSNCHRMLHRGTKLLTVNQLKNIVVKRA